MVFRKSKCFTETHPQKSDHLKLGLSISETHSQKPRSSWSGTDYLWKKSLQSVEQGNPCALDYTKLIRKAFVLSNCVYNFDSSSLFFESFKHVHFATSIRMVNSRTDFRLCSKENGSEPGALKMWILWRPAWDFLYEKVRFLGRPRAKVRSPARCQWVHLWLLVILKVVKWARGSSMFW